MRILFSFLSLLLLFSHTASASREGEWGSSCGGEFLRDEHNPWFVKNVDAVTYCIEIDPAGCSASPASVERLTLEAIEYWKKELAGSGQLHGVGKQTFTLTAGTRCRGDEDLRFQFGYGTLNEAQLKYFSDHDEDPQDYVGIALRTHYDRVNLRGKGFIFISSDKGPRPYNRGEGVAKNLWSHDGLLFRVLQHEIGHVFGVAHTDDGFMASDFPEKMVRNYRDFRTVEAEPFFVPPSAYERCFLGLGEIAGCLKLSTKDGWASFELLTLGPKGQTLSVEKSVRSERGKAKIHFPLKIFLPKEQVVFPGNGEQSLRGPARQQFKLSADTVDAEDKKSQLLLELWPHALEIYRASETGIKKWY